LANKTLKAEINEKAFHVKSIFCLLGVDHSGLPICNYYCAPEPPGGNVIKLFTAVIYDFSQ